MRTFLRPLVPRMEFGVCLLRRCIPYSFFGFFLIAFSTLHAQRVSMNCFGQVNMSIPASGQIPLEPKMLTGMSDLNNVIVFLVGRDEPILDCREANTEVQYFLKDTVQNLECWGVILVEDKSDFEVECNDGVVPCINGLNSLNPADFITVLDNCLELDDLNISSAPTGSGSAYARGSDTIRIEEILWTLQDDEGAEKSCTSNVYITALPCDSLFVPGDTTIYCGQDPFDFDLTGYLNYSEEILNNNCGIAVNTCITDSIPFNCGSKIKYIRKWQISDWATGSVKDTIQIIYVEDTTDVRIVAPEIAPVIFESGNPFIIIPPVDSIIQNCSMIDDYNLRVIVNGGIVRHEIGDTVPGIFGGNELAYIGRSICPQNIIPDTTRFDIPTEVGPIITCDSSLNRAISMNFQDSIKVLIDSAFASAQVSSVLPYKLLARKLDPICGTTADTFMTYLEFCVKETGPKIAIELIAEDSLGQRSDTCEVWLDIQEKTPPTLMINPNPVVELDASGMFTLDSAIIIASFADNSCCINNISVTGSGLGMTAAGMMTGSMSFLNDGVWSTFECQDTGSYFIEVSVTDCSNNISVDTTTLTVASGGNCTDFVAPAYTGEVNAYGLIPLEGAVITASTTELDFIALTDEEGQFALPIQEGEEYELSALYPDEWSVGITAHDLALIEEHIIGVRELDMYQEESADVDGNNKITASDVLSARKILLGIQEDIPGLEPWIFRHRKADQLRDLAGISTDELNYGGLDIQSMKRGDIDADAMGTSLVRSTGEIRIEQRTTSDNQHSLYRIHLGSANDLSALQVSLNLAADYSWEILNQHEDLYVVHSSNQLNVLYYKQNVDTPLYIDLEILNENGKVPNEGAMPAVSITNQLSPRMWTAEGEVRSIQLEHMNSISGHSNDISLAAYPNPTSDNITIAIQKVSDEHYQRAQLNVHDAIGKVVSTQAIDLPNGVEILEVPVDLPSEQGLYFLTLETALQRTQLKIVKN